MSEAVRQQQQETLVLLLETLERLASIGSSTLNSIHCIGGILLHTQSDFLVHVADTE